MIDGYNLIRQSPHLSQFEALDLERGREALLERLAVYAKVRGHKITVVFDGWGNPHLKSKELTQRGIKVIFTRRGETADDWIKRRLKEFKEAVVVSSDREVKSWAERMGAFSISSDEFEKKMEEALYMDLKGIDLDEDGSAEPIKKGPARRLSKRERKRRSVWQRL